jgi:hypothetical protein
MMFRAGKFVIIHSSFLWCLWIGLHTFWMSNDLSSKIYGASLSRNILLYKLQHIYNLSSNMNHVVPEALL